MRDKRVLRRCCPPSATSHRSEDDIQSGPCCSHHAAAAQLPQPLPSCPRPGPAPTLRLRPEGRMPWQGTTSTGHSRRPGTVPALPCQHRPASRVTGDGPLPAGGGGGTSAAAALPRPVPDPTTSPSRRRHFALLAAERLPRCPLGNVVRRAGWLRGAAGEWGGRDYNSRQAPLLGSALPAPPGTSGVPPHAT